MLGCWGVGVSGFIKTTAPITLVNFPCVRVLFVLLWTTSMASNADGQHSINLTCGSLKRPTALPPPTAC